MLLNEIPNISVMLKLTLANKVKLLHQFIFYKDDLRLNRKNFRNFQGFDFAVNSAEFQTKLKKVTAQFLKLELIATANLLAIEIDVTELEIAKRIITALTEYKC